MIFELTMTNLISLAGLFFGALWALLKVIGGQAERRANEQFAALQASLTNLSVDMRREADAARQLETSFLKFQAELPRDYVRRDDFVHVLGTINTRLDNFALRVERVIDNRLGNVQ
ncbi:membrane protein [Acidovorax sp. DW039]|uniref:hypothetical protein n=1 Tax=Acidovorax sp. DW039 TaxID=3095606 RepID=UPI00308AF3E8|nr:membrane protein [Acidovorax sp. DW039]